MTIKTTTKIVLLGVLVLLGSIVSSQDVFAESNISISISSNSMAFNLLPGEFGSDSQTITASTTDSAGYTIKISTTGGSSSLVNIADSSKTIPTFSLPSGQDSIPFNSLSDGYGYSIDSGANYLPVPSPSDAAKVLFRTNAAGQNTHTLTFGVKVPLGTVAGTYENTFEIQIVANLPPCPNGSICYYGNGDDSTGTMSNQTASSNSETTLIPSNFSRSGYGFAGWNTAIDGSGTNYGPNETITTGDLSTQGMQLYAKWVASAGNFQDWNGCDNLSAGDITALTDTRDGNTYAVAKYADGNCWMMENLRLDLSDENLVISTQNTNKPTQAFMKNINQNHPSSTNSFCASSTAACVNTIKHNTDNTNRGLTASYNTNDTATSWYSYGHYYNWHTITAGNGTLADSTAGATVSGDICPSGWRLPTGYDITGNLAELDIAMNGSGINQASGSTAGLAGSKRWRKYPLNYIYSGEYKATVSNRAISASSATRNIANTERTINLWLKTDGVYVNSNMTYKYRGQTARCIFHGTQSIIGNIHYDSNGGTGTMADQTNVDFYSATAANNGFTKQHARFSGWNTQANGRGVAVAEGGSVQDASDQLSLTDGDTLNLYAIWTPIYSLIYNGNGADAGSMSSVDVVDSLTAGKLRLVASNFSRTGYGFAGWSLDNDAATKLLSGTQVKVYGPNEVAVVDNAFLAYADTNNEINLYAVWIPADTNYTLQTFTSTECGAMSIGDVTALTDTRDSNTYAVAKLEDGKCWTIENLRLDPATTTFDSNNTNFPTQDFIDAALVSSTNNTLCNQYTTACVDSVRFNTNNINRNNTASHDSNTVNKSWYSYGVMYNWYTASAGNGDLAMDNGNVTGDICPKGWRLPTSGSNGEYANLNRLANNNSSIDTAGLLKFPDNFILSGDYNYNAPGGRNSFSRFWSATPDGTQKAFRLGINYGASNNAVTPAGSWGKWDAFAVRCIVK